MTTKKTNKNSLIHKDEALRLLGRLGEEFAVIPNPGYLHPAYEIVPLAPKLTQPSGPLVAVVMDMDGTTTTTEELCIHALEFMIRKASGRMGKDEWPGLDHERDYPNIIGNSTTKHVEYLVAAYRPMIDPDRLRSAYFHAALWTLLLGRDEQRANDVRNNCLNLGCGPMLADPRLGERGPFSEETVAELADAMCARYGGDFTVSDQSRMVRASIDIYYQRYHQILREMQSGRGEDLARELLGDPARRLIEPMPGIGIALALMKGWLGRDVTLLFDMLVSELHQKTGAQYDDRTLERARKNLAHLGLYFQDHPLKLSVVTSSIFYEANIVMAEVCHVIQQQIDRWPIPDPKRREIRTRFASYVNIYDGFITANDSSEIRLKPHRDLYSMALHALGVPKSEFTRVAGFEDSESGTFAIRAAGIGLCVAVPFEHSKGHNLDAASFILPGGVPEALIVHNLFMPIV